jgi:hypothetical protein
MRKKSEDGVFATMFGFLKIKEDFCERLINWNRPYYLGKQCHQGLETQSMCLLINMQKKAI